MMVRINVLLAMAVFSSALYLVQIEYAIRKLHAVQDAEYVQTQSLQEERHTLLRQRDQAMPHNIQQIARERLHMQFATAATTQYRIDSDSHSTPTGP